MVLSPNLYFGFALGIYRSVDHAIFSLQQVGGETTEYKIKPGQILNYAGHTYNLKLEVVLANGKSPIE